MKKRALLVGVDAYEFLGNLEFARADAEAFADALVDFCGFDGDSIHLLTCGFHGAAKALSRSIERALDDLTQEKEVDLLVFGFWGHGFRPSADKHFLCGLDTASDDLERSAIHLDLVKAKLCQVGARDTLILLDCCQSRPTSQDRSGATGALESGVTESLSGMARDISARSSRPTLTHTVAILMACSEGQKAYEWPERRHGIFTGHLLEAFALGHLSIAELTTHLSSEVPTTARRLWRSEQVPFCEIKGGKTDIDIGERSERKQTHRPYAFPFSAEAGEPKRWHWNDEAGMHGPYSLRELIELVKSGVVAGNAQVWEPAMNEWCKVSDLATLSRHIPKELALPPITAASLIYRSEYSRRYNIIICTGDSFGFGRDASNPEVDILLRPRRGEDEEAFRFISRHHFRIEWQKGNWLLRLPDKTPTNNLFVNDIAVSGAVMLNRPCNVVQMGDVMELRVDIYSSGSGGQLPDQQLAGGCCLVRLAGQEKQAEDEKFVLLRQDATLGSAQNNAIHIPAKGVMPNQAVVINRNKRLWIKRIGDQGKLRLNDTDLESYAQVPLSYGDRLQIGTVKARIVPKRFFK